MKGTFPDEKMSMSVKANVAYLLVSESYKLGEQSFRQFRPHWWSFVMRLRLFLHTNHTQYQEYLNTVRLVAATWEDADSPKAIEQMEC